MSILPHCLEICENSDKILILYRKNPRIGKRITLSFGPFCGKNFKAKVMKRLTVRHRTVYHYRETVSFGPHRLMFRPRDSHDLHLIDTALSIQPTAHIRWMHDVFGNSIAIADFETQADTLSFESIIRLRHYGLYNPEFTIEPFAQKLPFTYSAEDIPDLGRTIERHYPDPDHKIDQWTQQVLAEAQDQESITILRAINHAIKAQFDYSARYDPGTQNPLETLEKGSGTCRDFALFMMEACRSLGLAARFVSGYLYDPQLDSSKTETANDAPKIVSPSANNKDVIGAGSTHAWMQVYLPGAGWVEFDPTNNLVGGDNLIRVAVARDPSQAIPLVGSYYGAEEAYEGMTVDVEVLQEDLMPETLPELQGQEDSLGDGTLGAPPQDAPLDHGPVSPPNVRLAAHR